ncbi:MULTISPECIES: autotransporter outer membrane beta-barrel domain-containing protein [Pseudomonas]|uniref:Autotransporter domain-containing protein n=2 Tax=Pseudomonas TaxID=286 RepID=A0A0W0HMA7_PSEFL|nr:MULTISPECIES: autotransporter outer membrane beta-barrel domain-containing protein [Pseudomonas]KTB61952.1 hypothetical protein AO063_24435 [Pseudomonas fluorescens ICMP 11288]RMQ85029.1 hypothetical protein ALP97_01760 [Pseudomonas salomonii]
MSALNTFELKPLSAMIKVPTITFCLFAAMQGQAQAVQLGTGEQRTIDATEQSTDWQLSGQSALTMNRATATTVDLANSTLNMNSGSVANRVHAVRGSTVNMDGARITSNNALNGAVRLDSSKADIKNSTLTNTNGVGLQVFGMAGGANPSSADVSNTTISGAFGGAEVAAGSELHIKQNSVVQGTGAGAFGLSLAGATATVTESTIIGNGHGVSITRNRQDSTDGKLVLDQSVVEGRTGSALSVRGTPGQVPVVSIDVLNGSTLKGGNGNLLSVTGGATATMNVDNSRNLVGNVIADATSTVHLNLQNNAELKGQLQGVDTVRVGNNSNLFITGDSQARSLNVDRGTVTLGAPGEFYRLKLDSLSGEGRFVGSVNFDEGKASFIDVANEATGNHTLALSASGSEPVKTQVVHTGGGDAVFALEGGPVELGAYGYDLEKVGDDWFLNTKTRVVSRSARVVTALFNTPVTIMTAEEGALRARMGELRYAPHGTGLWVRGFGSQYDISQSSGTGYSQNLKGFSLGLDTALGESPWKMGVFGGYSKSDLNPVRGAAGTVDSYFLGTYLTYLHENGVYFDVVAKANRFQNQAKATLSDNTSTKGGYNNVGGGVSAELGRHIKFGESFVEPYGRLSTMVVQGGTYSLKNGLQVDGERTYSRTAEAGAKIGHEFQSNDGTLIKPYLSAAMVHEFANNNKVTVNNQTFNNDLSGSRSKFGAGVAVSFSESLQGHFDVETSTSSKIKQRASVNVGMRYAF